MAMRGVPEHWHLDDQFQRQLGSPGQRAVVHRRWAAFGEMLSDYSSRAEGARPLRVLDAGCGDGINLVGLRQLASHVPRQLDLFAIDLSPVRVQRARTAERAAGAIALASVTALPFESGHFDVVLCSQVIEHVPAAEAAAREVARVLRPGGLALIGVPNEGCALAGLRNHVLQRSILTTTDHVNFFTRRTLRDLLVHAGLDVVEIRTGGFFLPHLRLSNLVMGSPAGRLILDSAGRLLPSQAAELIAVAYRSA
jgi:SAM-dependent methyltransferase